LSEAYALRVKEITKRFPGTKALSGVSFDLRQGEIMALVGENGAGKSTLCNIIGGVLQPNSGEIEILGKTVTNLTPRDAANAGIGFVHQELASCQNLTVAENVFIGRLNKFHNKLGLVDYKKLNKATAILLKKFNSKIKPDQKIRELKIADQQVVEIVRSLSISCKILILDEPTSALTKSEIDTLFKLIKELKNSGISIIYISHRMDEVLELSDRVTILRDGCLIETLNTNNTTAEEIVGKMVGRIITNFYPPKSQNIENVILEAKNLSIKGLFENVSFSLKKGEILGIAGLVGAGRTEVICGMCGLRKLDSGEVFIGGEKLEISNYSDAIKKGISYLTEDRKKQGLFLRMSLKQNISATNLKNITRGLLINNNKESKTAKEYVKKLGIKASSVDDKVNFLSGGNQQKVMFAKWLYTNPKVFALDEPTRGIDVGAKSEIHNMLRDLCNEGMGIIVISSELPEIIGLCDRAIVMHEGKVVGEATKDDLNEHTLITMASAINNNYQFETELSNYAK